MLDSRICTKHQGIRTVSPIRRKNVLFYSNPDPPASLTCDPRTCFHEKNIATQKKTWKKQDFSISVAIRYRHQKKKLKKTRFFNFCGDTVSPHIATKKKRLKRTRFFNFCGDTVSPHIATKKNSWKKQNFSISVAIRYRHTSPSKKKVEKNKIFQFPHIATKKKKLKKKIKKKIFQFTPKKFEKTKIFEFLWRSGIATYCHTSPPKDFFFFSVAIPYCHTSPPKEKSLKQRHFFVFRCDTGTRYRHVLPHIATKWKKRYKNHFFVFRGDTGTATYCHTSPPKEKKNKNVIFFFSVAIPVPPHIATHRHPRKKRFKKVIFFVFRGDAGTATYCHTSPPKEKN